MDLCGSEQVDEYRMVPASASRSTSLPVLIGGEGGQAAGPNPVMAGNLSRPQYRN